MKTNIPTLACLAVLAFAFLSAPSASAKIIYTDIDPDITRSSTCNTKLDIDEDGVNDLEVDLNIMGLKDVWITLNTLGETKVAMQDWHSRLFQRYESVNDSSEWMHDVSVPLAYLTSGKPEGPWPGKTNSYLGFRLTKDGSSLFGWMRIEVAENVRSFSIREIAYEDLPDFPIMAGDKAKEVSINEIKPGNADSKFMLRNRILRVNNADAAQFTKLYVLDMAGKVVVSANITSGSNELDLNMLPAGIYCINLYSKRKSYTKKVALN